MSVTFINDYTERSMRKVFAQKIIGMLYAKHNERNINMIYIKKDNH